MDNITVSTATNPELRDLQDKAMSFAIDVHNKEELERLQFGFWLNNELEHIWAKGVKNADVVDFNAIVKILFDFIFPPVPEVETV